MENLNIGQQITDSKVAELLSISRATVWRWVKAGKLPAPRKLGDNTTRFDASEVMAKIKEVRAA